MAHIAIIGAGIVGVSSAIWLQREGFEVTLIDRVGPAEGASFGNGGVLASCAMVPVTGPGLVRKAPAMLFDKNQPLFLKWGYLPRLAPWLMKYLRHANADDTYRIADAIAGVVGDSLAEHQALSEGTAAAKYVVPSDYVYLYENQAAFEAESFSWDIRARHGHRWETLEGSALRAFDRAFSPGLGFAVRMGDHGRISDPGRYVKSLAGHFEDEGGTVVTGDVTDIRVSNGAVSGLQIGDQMMDCDRVIIATGAWSSPLMQKLGIKVPLESERGYHIELWEPSVMPKAPVMISKGKFVVTPMDGRLRVAGLVEFGGLKAAPSTEPFEFLKRHVTAAIPGLKWSRETEWMGHRPATSDSIPVIGALPNLTGAYAAFGHHHIGLTAGPKTGRLLAQLIADKKPNLDLTPYSPARFSQ